MQLQSSLIQLESSLIQLLLVRIALKSSLIVIITSKNRIVELSNSVLTSKNAIAVTGMTRRETGGSKCKLFIKEHGQYRQGRAGANRYGMGKTQE